MKLRLLIFIFLMSAKGLFAQSSNVQAASNWLKTNDLARAKDCIDQAAVHEKTSNDPKMWYYRGMVYLAVYRDTTAIGKADPDAPEKAAISFMNCLKTDKGKYYVDDCNNQIWICGAALFKRANERYLVNDFERATRLYTMIFDIIPLDKEDNLKRTMINPDILNKNLYYAANKAGDAEKAKGYLQKLIDNKFNEPLIYIYMSNIYLAQKDTTTALTFINKGRNLFEADQRLIDEEIRLYSLMGKVDVLIEKISKVLEDNPDNERLFFMRGTLYGNAMQFDKAREDYKKAIELKPDYFEANYYLGVMYNNEAAEKLKSISSIKNNDEYAKEKEKCEAIYNQSQPYFEKAHQLNPKDKNTMILLRSLYLRQKEMDKYNDMKAQIEAGGK